MWLAIYLVYVHRSVIYSVSITSAAVNAQKKVLQHSSTALWCDLSTNCAFTAFKVLKYFRAYFHRKAFVAAGRSVYMFGEKYMHICIYIYLQINK